MSNFNEIYWKSKAPELKELFDADATDPSYMDRVYRLIAKGFVIDVPIMVWQHDPEKLMALRQFYGYTTVPSAMGNPLIKVSLDPADYPPYKPNSQLGFAL